MKQRMGEKDENGEKWEELIKKKGIPYEQVKEIVSLLPSLNENVDRKDC